MKTKTAGAEGIDANLKDTMTLRSEPIHIGLSNCLDDNQLRSPQKGVQRTPRPASPIREA
jgi:hypothetical protein